MAKCVWPFDFATPRNCSLLSRSGNAVQKISEWAPKQASSKRKPPGATQGRLMVMAAAASRGVKNSPSQ
jgi:hypothetical protein